MSTALPFNDRAFKEAFEKILSNGQFEKVITEIAQLIYRNELNKQSFDSLLEKHGVAQIEKIKPPLLDLLLLYINLILDDKYLTETEARNIKFLKRFFKITEGDFYEYRYYDIEKILDRQFDHMYRDNKVDKGEALQKVALQEIFDLGYDQFLQLIEKAVQAALDRGANVEDLDTFIKAGRLL